MQLWLELWLELWVGVFSGFRSNLLKNMVGAWDSNPRPLRADRTCSMSIPSRSAGLVLADSDLAFDHPGSGRRVLRPRGNESPAD